MDERQELLEMFGVPDVFVTGLAHVENIGGGCWRFTFFTSQEVGGKQEMVVAAKIIMPGESVPEAMHMTALTTHTCACQNVRAMARN
jgi:hypothetical protein